MKTFLIYLVISYIVQVVLILISVYFDPYPIKTLGDLIKNALKLNAIMWIPVVGLIISVFYVVLITCEPIWDKISRIKLRK